MRAPLILASTSLVVLAVTSPADAGATGIYKNCTALHTKYPHGIGRATAHDKTSGQPVTTFKHDTRGYNIAIQNNAGLDGDKDGIACEKR